ncbi:hypothetical protein PG985_016345 [Apiospora marii]|uniref:uncharacterized protein n=1 Tax=Apiospora marii TaxID=335849 RepID=UPI00312E7516
MRNLRNLWAIPSTSWEIGNQLRLTIEICSIQIGWNRAFQIQTRSAAIGLVRVGKAYHLFKRVIGVAATAKTIIELPNFNVFAATRADTLATAPVVSHDDNRTSTFVVLIAIPKSGGNFANGSITRGHWLRSFFALLELLIADGLETCLCCVCLVSEHADMMA